MKVIIAVRRKREVLDPQGKAIQHACGSLGHAAVSSVRQDKLFELEIDASSRDQARALASEIAEKLLSNPVMEDWEIVALE
jgi:phosphoribosylformylglycinamidine synthase